MLKENFPRATKTSGRERAEQLQGRENEALSYSIKKTEPVIITLILSFST